MKKEKKQLWAITIAGWGTLWGKGTETQAEKFRVHKCNWEQAVGTKAVVMKEQKPPEKEWEDLSEF